MKRYVLLFSVCVLVAARVFAIGHGGGHGGHGGHASGGHSSSHASGHVGASHVGAAHSSGAHVGGGHTGGAHVSGGHVSPGGFHSPSHAAPHINTNTIIHRATTPAAVIANHPKKTHPNTTYIAVPPRNDKKVDNPIPVYSGYGYYNPYYSPFYYDPYFSLWSFAFNMSFSPNYGFGRQADDYYYENENTDDSLEGYVVYAHDTISGLVTIGSGAVFLETADSAQSYDYKFRIRKKELEYVTAYNSDDKQIKLVRLPINKNQLWRVVHEGKLNVYDDGRGLIYRPEDIDKLGLMTSYNGKLIKLSSISQVKAKEQLIKCVNEAYGVKLDPRNAGWNEFLIYLDKLD